MGRTILIVEDEPLIALMLQDWLTELGYEAAGPAVTVENALALIENTVLDGAILDVTLGATDSFPVARVLIARAIPLVLATGHTANMIDPEFRSLPILSKPYQLADVERAVRSFG